MALPGKGVVRERYSLKLTPLTPVHVWSGRNAFVGVDAALQGSELCIINLDRIPANTLFKVVKEGPSIKEVANALARAGVCGKKLALSGVSSLPANSEVRLLSREVVPASTIKGYLRTAIMHYMLNSKYGRKLASTFRSCIDLTKRPKQVSSGLEGKVFRMPRSTKARGFIDLMQKVAVSEPEVGGCRTALTEFQVHELVGSNTVLKAKVFVEALVGGTLTYRVAMLENVSEGLVATKREVVSGMISKYEEVYGINLLNALRDFGCVVLKEELGRVERVGRLRAYASLLREWLSKYCEGEGDCVISRVGFMTGHESKTVLHLLKTVDEGLYNQVVSYMSRHVGRVWDSRTLKLVVTPNGLIGVGWCEVCVEKA